MNDPQDWTGDEFAILRNLAGKESAFQIGKRLGRSAASVQSKAARHGMSLAVPAEIHPIETVAHARALSRTGMSSRDIAKHMKINHSTVYAWVNEITRPTELKLCADQAAIVIRETIRSCAAKFGKKPSEIHKAKQNDKIALEARDEAIKLCYQQQVSKPMLCAAFARTRAAINLSLKSTPRTTTTPMKTTTALDTAKKIILAHVNDWDSQVLDAAADAAMRGMNPYDFDGRPEDESEMRAFALAFRKIQAA
jgi:hypothetical protein